MGGQNGLEIIQAFSSYGMSFITNTTAHPWYPQLHFQYPLPLLWIQKRVALWTWLWLFDIFVISFLVTVPPIHCNQVEIAMHVAADGYWNAQVAETPKNRVKQWKDWMQWCKLMGCNPYLAKHTTNYTTKCWAIMSYMGEVRQGNFGLSKKVAVDTVGTALTAIGPTIDLEQGYNPLKRNNDKYTKAIVEILQGWSKQAPPTMWRSYPLK